MRTDQNSQPTFNIAAVERDTGLSKDTLRVWERRYGFPCPSRDANGDRIYPPEQVEKLRLIRRLLDQGRRPSKIVGADLASLRRELEAVPDEPLSVTAVDEAGFLRMLRLHHSDELRSSLQQMLLRQGLQRFVADTIAALNVAVGQAWLRGELDVPEEHFYSEQVQNVLRNAIGSQPGPGGTPRILLTTFPEELHALGLLMVEAMLVPEGAACISLGTQTPLADIRSAALAGRIDVVALSFSSAYPLRQALEGLTRLRRMLAPEVALWAGGAAIQGKAGRLEGIRVVASLDDAVAALGEWRAAHPA